MDILPAGFFEGLLRSMLLVAPVLIVMLYLRARTPLPLGGLMVIAVSAVAIAGLNVGVWMLVGGALLAGAGGLMGRVLMPSRPARVLLVLPGMVLAVTAVDYGGNAWIGPVAVVVAALSGVAADAVDEGYGRNGMTLTMVLVSVAGVFLTIPETGLIGPVLGALVVVAVLGWPLGLVRLGPGGGSAVIALLTALVVHGGWVREGAVVGGLAAPALLVLLALVPTPSPDQGEHDPWSKTTVQLLVLHGFVTLAVSRIAGLREGVLSAALLATVFGLTGWWLAKRVTVQPAVVTLPPPSGGY